MMRSEFLAFAHQLADAAGAVIRPYFGAHGEVAAKGDQSPVTIADRAAEEAMRVLIQERFPEHGIYGEEFGQQIAASAVSLSLRERLGEGGIRADGSDISPTPAQARPSPNPLPQGEGFAAAPSQPHYTWVLDPIDGTRAFIAGRKEWGTLIALCEDGVPILGVLDQPVTGERWVGVKGEPTQYSTIPASIAASQARGPETTIKTRPCASLAEAELSTTSATYFTPVQAKQVIALACSCRATVKDGDCYAYGLLARGVRDIVIDAGLKPYDILALVPIIEGAGGVIMGWDGEAVTLANYANVVAAGDAGLHSQLLSALGS